MKVAVQGKAARPFAIMTALACFSPSVVLAVANFNVSTVPELKVAVEAAGTNGEETVITLAAGTYSFANETMMTAKSCLSVDAMVDRSGMLTLQGDPAVSREQVVIDAAGKGRALYLFRNGWGGGLLTVANLTVENGATDESFGGGLEVPYYAQTVVSNCVFRNCHAQNKGGALHFANGSVGRVIDCLFEENSTPDGDCGALNDALVVAGCTFKNNRALGAMANGGAMMISPNYAGTVTNCLFSGNYTQGSYGMGGAVYARSGVIVDCVFTNNCTCGDRAAQHGGAVYLQDDGIRVVGCRFVDNHAKDGNGGAVGVADASANVEIMGCRFEANYVSAGGNNGGGVAGCAGLVSNCVFTANRANMGGGVYVCGNVRNCVLAGNYSPRDDGYASGAAANGSTLYDCVITNNVSFYSLGGVVNCRVYRSLVSGNRSEYYPLLRLQDSEDSYFESCTLAGAADQPGFGTLFSRCSLDRCVVRGNNLKNAATEEEGSGFLFAGICSVTNTLFESNVVARLFANVSGTDNSIVNCTFVGNRYDYLCVFSEAGMACRVANCCFEGNGTHSWGFADEEIGQEPMAGLAFDHSILKTHQTLVGTGNINRLDPEYENLSLRMMGSRDPSRPYAPRRRSPLNGAGEVMPWMASAVDLDGHPRLTAGRVAMGAYETAEESTGFAILFR